METRKLGTSDLNVSVVGLGCNNLGRPGTVTEDQAGTDRLVHAAIDQGITLLDTADIYGGPPTTSETLLGGALKGRRDQVVLATKWGHQSLAVPGTEETVVQARALTKDGPVAVPGDGVVRVPGGTVREVDLSTMPAGAYAIQIRADHPIVAGVMSERRPKATAGLTRATAIARLRIAGNNAPFNFRRLKERHALFLQTGSSAAGAAGAGGLQQ